MLSKIRSVAVILCFILNNNTIIKEALECTYEDKGLISTNEYGGVKETPGPTVKSILWIISYPDAVY